MSGNNSSSRNSEGRERTDYSEDDEEVKKERIYTSKEEEASKEEKSAVEDVKINDSNHSSSNLSSSSSPQPPSFLPIHSSPLPPPPVNILNPQTTTQCPCPQSQVKRHWLGPEYKRVGIAGNDIEKTNVPDLRVQYRHDALINELSCLFMDVEDDIRHKVPPTHGP